MTGSLLAALLARSKAYHRRSERGTGAGSPAFYDRLAKVAARAGATAKLMSGSWTSTPVRTSRSASI